MFQIKDFASISASCINLMRTMQKKVTDFSVGSVARTMLEAVAAELEELYMRMFVGLKEAIPVAIYRTFDFQLLSAQPAFGTIRANFSTSASERVISAGTVFQPAGYSISFSTISDATLAAGSTQIDLAVVAATSGSAGNLPAGTDFSPAQNMEGFLSATSLFLFSQGRDLETEDERKLRFGAFIAALPRGTIKALEYGLSLATISDAYGNVSERVVYSKIVEPWLTDALQPVALVKVYIHNGATGASAGLLSRAQEVIDGYYDSSGSPVPGWKAAGVKVQVIAATNATVAVTGSVTVSPGYQVAEVLDEVSAAITNYISGLTIGAAVIRAEIIAAAMGVDGVTNFALSAPASDTTISSTAKAMPGTVTLTAV